MSVDERPRSPEPAWNVGPVATLIASAVAALAAVVAYWVGADMQVFGGLCAASFLLAGIGLVWWTRWAMPDELATDEREELASSDQERAELVATFARGSAGDQPSSAAHRFGGGRGRRLYRAGGVAPALARPGAGAGPAPHGLAGLAPGCHRGREPRKAR